MSFVIEALFVLFEIKIKRLFNIALKAAHI